jgi:hypothetical protein
MPLPATELTAIEVANSAGWFGLLDAEVGDENGANWAPGRRCVGDTVMHTHDSLELLESTGGHGLAGPISCIHVKHPLRLAILAAVATAIGI